MLLRVGRRHADEPLAGPVAGDLPRDDLGPLQGEVLSEFGLQALADIRHLGEVLRPAQVDPVPDLAGPHPALALGHAGLDEAGLQGVAGEADEGELPAGQGFGPELRGLLDRGESGRAGAVERRRRHGDAYPFV